MSKRFFILDSCLTSKSHLQCVFSFPPFISFVFFFVHFLLLHMFAYYTIHTFSCVGCTFKYNSWRKCVHVAMSNNYNLVVVISQKSEFVIKIALFVLNIDLDWSTQTLSPTPYHIPSLTILGQSNTLVTSMGDVLDLDDDEMHDYLEERAIWWCLKQDIITRPWNQVHEY